MTEPIGATSRRTRPIFSASCVLPYFEALGQKAAQGQATHVDYLAELIDGESLRREERSTLRRIAQARLPVIKTLDQFEWSWPASINQMQIRNLFRLAFLEKKGT